MRLISFAAGLLAGLVIPTATAAQEFAGYALETPETELNLPQVLIEISGLAPASDHSVYAHNDEFAIVYEVDLNSGEYISAFALGDPSAKGDFEGIATENGRIYLVTSAGLLYEAPIGKHRERVHFNIYDLGLHDQCEVEGLSNGPAPEEFLILCKTPVSAGLKNRLSIFKWSLKDRLPEEQPWLSVSLDDILSADEKKLFRPSGLEWRKYDNSLLIVSARNQMILSIDEKGRLISKARLDQQNHVQTEGITLLPNGQLVLSDEGAGRRYGRLTIYNPN